VDAISSNRSNRNLSAKLIEESGHTRLDLCADARPIRGRKTCDLAGQSVIESFKRTIDVCQFGLDRIPHPVNRGLSVHDILKSGMDFCVGVEDLLTHLTINPTGGRHGGLEYFLDLLLGD
jgi:hypothetical protein